jgi:hypothetical protein
VLLDSTRALHGTSALYFLEVDNSGKVRRLPLSVFPCKEVFDASIMCFV